jgi:hypothetical protein
MYPVSAATVNAFALARDYDCDCSCSAYVTVGGYATDPNAMGKPPPVVSISCLIHSLIHCRDCVGEATDGGQGSPPTTDTASVRGWPKPASKHRGGGVHIWTAAVGSELWAEPQTLAPTRRLRLRGRCVQLYAICEIVIAVRVPTTLRGRISSHLISSPSPSASASASASLPLHYSTLHYTTLHYTMGPLHGGASCPPSND